VLGEVVEAAPQEAAEVAMHEIHTVMAKEMVEAVAKEATSAALCEIQHEAAKVTLDSVAREATTIVLRKLRHATAVRKEAAKTVEREKTERAADDTTEEDRLAEAAVVSMSWELLGGEEEVDGPTHDARPSTPPM
jgi:hypothetical protein